MKLLIDSNGVFGFSQRAINLMCKYKNLNYDDNENDNLFEISCNPKIRFDKDAIKAVEKLGITANADGSQIVVAEIPDGYDYRIIVPDTGGEDLYFSKSKIHLFEPKIDYEQLENQRNDYYWNHKL